MPKYENDADGSYTVLRLREKVNHSAELKDHGEVQLKDLCSYCFSIDGTLFAYMTEKEERVKIEDDEEESINLENSVNGTN